jgi:hypothetical protein
VWIKTPHQPVCGALQGKNSRLPDCQQGTCETAETALRALATAAMLRQYTVSASGASVSHTQQDIILTLCRDALFSLSTCWRMRIASSIVIRQCPRVADSSTSTSSKRPLGEPGRALSSHRPCRHTASLSLPSRPTLVLEQRHVIQLLKLQLGLINQE